MSSLDFSSARTDLRCASLRDWFVELLWLFKKHEMALKPACGVVNWSIELFGILVGDESSVPLVLRLQKELLDEQFYFLRKFFGQTLVQHHKLWRFVLVKVE